MAAHVLAAGAGDPDKTALAILSLSGAERWRYGALRAAVQGIARGLHERGLRPGDRLLMRLGNDVQFPLAYLGAIWAGVLPIPASAALTGPEITRIAEETDPALIVRAEGLALPDPCPWPVLGADALTQMQALPPLPPDLGDPDRPAYIVYTSGTSGRARGVVHAHRAILARQMMWQGWYGLGAGDRMMHAGAFNWTYTLGTGLMDPWAIGATALIPAGGIAADRLPLLMRRHDATIFAAAPGVYRQMLKSGAPLDLPRLRHGLSAGERLPDSIRAAWTAATGLSLHEALGMSECSTFISGAPDRPARAGTSGWPQRGRQIAVLGPDGTPVARETPGVLAVHRSDPGLMLGYWNAPEETARRFSGDWFVTGDTVVMHEDGAVSYLGRDDDMMNAGGYRVSPLEVEAALLAHPGIAEVACAEIRVKADTTVIAAFWTGPAPIDSATLADFAAARLARYKCPRLWLRLEALPRAGNNKIDRKALRQRTPDDFA